MTLLTPYPPVINPYNANKLYPPAGSALNSTPGFPPPVPKAIVPTPWQPAGIPTQTEVRPLLGLSGTLAWPGAPTLQALPPLTPARSPLYQSDVAPSANGFPLDSVQWAYLGFGLLGMAALGATTFAILSQRKENAEPKPPPAVNQQVEKPKAKSNEDPNPVKEESPVTRTPIPPDDSSSLPAPDTYNQPVADPGRDEPKPTDPITTRKVKDHTQIPADETAAPEEKPIVSELRNAEKEKSIETPVVKETSPAFSRIKTTSGELMGATGIWLSKNSQKVVDAARQIPYTKAINAVATESCKVGLAGLSIMGGLSYQLLNAALNHSGKPAETVPVESDAQQAKADPVDNSKSLEETVPEDGGKKTATNSLDSGKQVVADPVGREKKAQERTIVEFVRDSAISPLEAQRLKAVIQQDKALLELITTLRHNPQAAEQPDARLLMRKHVMSLLPKSRYGASPRHDVHRQIVYLLHKKGGVSVPLQLGDGTLTLTAALRNRQADVAEMIIKGMSPEESAWLLNEKDFAGQTALQVAVKNNLMDQAVSMVKLGADTFVRDNDGKTAWDYVSGVGLGYLRDKLLKGCTPASLDCLKQLELRKELALVGKGKDELVLQPLPGADVHLNGRRQPENTPVKCAPGDILQAKNALYRASPDLRLVNISSDAALTKYLFPDGLKTLNYKQGKIGDCAKLTVIHSLLADPDGVGTKSVLSAFRQDKDNIYLQSSRGAETFRKLEEIRIDSKGRRVYRRKGDDQRPVNGPLGVQLLERAHYRAVREAVKKERESSNPVASVVGTLIKTNTKQDFDWSDDFGINLLGSVFWAPYTQDGTVRIRPGDAYWGHREKRRWAYALSEPFSQLKGSEKKRLESFLDQLEQDPGSFFGSVGTKVSTEDRSTDQGAADISLKDTKEKLFSEHAYFLQRITRDPQGQRRFLLINPHDSSTPLNLTERDFMDNFYMFNGIVPLYKT